MDTSAASTSAHNQHHPSFAPTGTIEVPVFYPTIEEMRDFPTLINKIEQQHRAHLVCGIAKIVPPPEFYARKSGDYSDVDNYVIDQPVKEKIEGNAGVYTKTNRLYRRSITVQEFRALAKKSPFPKGDLPPQEIEKYYWKHVLQGEPVYGADSPGTICDENLREFNMNRLGTVLDMLDSSGNYFRNAELICNLSKPYKSSHPVSVKIKGVNTVYLYFGMWKTTFPWHPEDMDLYSINYVHFGKPKFWYAIATDSLSRFERFAAQCFPSAAKTCKSFLRHKTFMISPHVLRKNNIRYGTMVQYANEFIITFPRGYHMGFNIGYNCAESTNFGSDRWIDFGKNALVCGCRSDSVEIDMRPFMKTYRAAEYDEWYQYWYGERLAKERKRVTSSKRQPVYDEKAVERKKRRKTQKSGGARGPHVEEGIRTGSSGFNGDMNGYQQEVSAVASNMIVNNKWKKEVRDLWSNLPGSLYAEKEFNIRHAYETPHCSVCQYFVPRPLMEKKKNLPLTSQRLVKRAYYAKMNPETYNINEDDAACDDRLFKCANCFVVVHEGCYPIGNIPNDITQWRCVRCRQRDDLALRSASCHLCELRGGALIPCENSEGEFVHVICALLNRRTVFLDPVKLTSAYTLPPPKFCAPNKYPDLMNKEYMGAFGENCERGKFECEFCLHSREGLLKCLSCDDTLFHATCGRLAGVSFEFRNWPDLTVAVCPEHNDGEVNTSAVSVGDNVRVCLGDSGRLLKGTVSSIEYHDCCTVNFMDRNWSDDLPSEDIVECECSRFKCNGWHVPGAKIKVKWDDGLIYDGIFRNRYQRAVYTVNLNAKQTQNHPAVVQVGRDAIFARGEKPNIV
ncbi:Uncharacterized protein BM_BM6641 [Brugia malayi]|uniref:[histone H3]-trimethyl-L-lysine(9) demethylase n=1 Tax=Brugia malayi TaxID=6279 RepID=A0A4E9FC25_BRUMA|nr:Uncharacterized protein BM_BM6641 [Brugia malayi]VIO94337.1 Uncharacterized protein BM_BM6641 [Brugia malayi]